jgi:hypothetical protein
LKLGELYHQQKLVFITIITIIYLLKNKGLSIESTTATAKSPPPFHGYFILIELRVGGDVRLKEGFHQTIVVY